MLRRLIIIGLFTGIAQVFSILSLKFIASKTDAYEIAQLAQTDSYFQLLLSIIAMGLQAGAIRDIASAADWQVFFKRVQTARTTLSLFVAPLGFFGLYHPAYYVFFLSPMLAASGDYALYATGRPVLGSLVACLRTVLPYSFVLITFLTIKNGISYSYLLGILFAYVLMNGYMSGVFKMKLFYRPDLSSLKLYVDTIPLGIINICLYIIGLGLIIFLPFFYPDEVIATAFVGLKLYLVVKGVLRLIHQAYIREMKYPEFCVKADQLSLLVTTVVACSLLFFTESTITALAGVRFVKYKGFFVCLGLAGLVYSFFLSMTTKALLDRKDKPYMRLSVIAALTALVVGMILSAFYPEALSIGISILAGELVFAIGMARMMSVYQLWRPRIEFLTRLLLGILPVAILRFFIADSLLLNISVNVVYTVCILFVYRKRFISSTTGYTKLNW